MEKYNYLESMVSDILDYLNENYKDLEGTIDREEFEEQLNDELWIADSVTGNASGSYTCNAWQAEENLCHNGDLLNEALEEFGADDKTYKRALQSAAIMQEIAEYRKICQQRARFAEKWLNI